MTRPVHSAALSVALNAKVNDLDDADVANLVTLAEELLAKDDPLKLAVTGFAVQHEVCRRDADALAMQGRILQSAVEVAIGIGRLPQQRADIDG